MHFIFLTNSKGEEHNPRTKKNNRWPWKAACLQLLRYMASEINNQGQEIAASSSLSLFYLPPVSCCRRDENPEYHINNMQYSYPNPISPTRVPGGSNTTVCYDTHQLSSVLGPPKCSQNLELSAAGLP